MNESQRRQIRDTARYLRHVRPIDPEEISAYVEGQPHPGAIRQVLREEAIRLGFREREDGQFEPVEDAPLSVEFDSVERFPEHLSRVVEDRLVERFGPGWPDGESGATLRARIRDFKTRYCHERTVTYDEVTALGYAIYHLPAYFATTQYVFAALAADDLLASRMRILDVGAGVGGPALALDALCGDALVDYHAVEPSAATTVLDHLLAETGPNFHTTVHHTPIEAFDPGEALDTGYESDESDGVFDIVLVANVLAELDDPVAQVERTLDWLVADGSVVAISPADRNTATGLRQIERAVESATGATVYGPEVRLWPHERPSSESWSFDRKPDIEVPAFQRRLDRGERTSAETGASESQMDDETPPRRPGDGEFENADVQYAYAILRLDGQSAIEFRPDASWAAKLATSERNVTERIDCVAVKLSHNLAETGNPLFLVGDGSQHLDHYAVLTDQSLLNRELDTADYGDLLRFENTLVLWNDDEGAYNLVVDGESVVERIPV